MNWSGEPGCPPYDLVLGWLLSVPGQRVPALAGRGRLLGAAYPGLRFAPAWAFTWPAFGPGCAEILGLKARNVTAWAAASLRAGPRLRTHKLLRPVWAPQDPDPWATGPGLSGQGPFRGGCLPRPPLRSSLGFHMAGLRPWFRGSPRADSPKCDSLGWSEPASGGPGWLADKSPRPARAPQRSIPLVPALQPGAVSRGTR